ncbi:Uncharacterised protein [Acinetobacter baumannii]|nr:Uncharacterised protein [Acinetobacter baumannii]
MFRGLFPTDRERQTYLGNSRDPLDAVQRCAEHRIQLSRIEQAATIGSTQQKQADAFFSIQRLEIEFEAQLNSLNQLIAALNSFDRVVIRVDRVSCSLDGNGNSR